MAEAEPICNSLEHLSVGRESEQSGVVGSNNNTSKKVGGIKNKKSEISIGQIQKEGEESDTVMGQGGSSSNNNNNNTNMQNSVPPPSSPAVVAGSNNNNNSNTGGSRRTTLSNNDTSSSSSSSLQALLVPDRLKFEVGASDDEEDTGDDAMNMDDDKQEEMFEKKADEQVGENGQASSTTAPSSGRFVEFENWLLDNGAQFPDLYLKRYTGDVRGVHSKCRVGPYVCIVQIPSKCLITDHMGRTETEIGRKLFSSNYSLSTPNLIAVIIYILTTREDPNHFFQPYYKILPSDYSNFPIFWNKEQLSWLKGSPLVDDIIERKRNMRADYDEVCRICPEFKRFSFDEFLEVRTAVGSRNFGIVVHGNKRTAMVPYADMLNHYRPRETSWTFEDSKDSFTITSLSPLQAGQQVMDSYGKKCNSKFLLHYGFAVECNREEDGKCQNEVYIRLGLRPQHQDSLYDQRLTILGASRSSRGFRLSMNIEDKATSEALSYCRVAVATEDELNLVFAQNGLGEDGSAREEQFRRYRDSSYRDSSVSFINTRNETAALEMLATACHRQLEKYSDSFENNMTLLNSGTVKPFSVRRTSLIVVIGEQEICNFWINACEKISDVLSATSEVPTHMALRSLPRSNPTEADLARYAGRLAYEIRMQSKQ